MPNKAQYIAYLQLPTIRALLDTIAWAEGGKSYNTMFGGGTFSGNQHPNYKVRAGGYNSDAAGRYQFLYSTWTEIKNRLGLADFTAPNQDIAALDLINQRGELQNAINGNLIGVLRGLGCAWAALPYSGCRQKERSVAEVTNYFNNALRVYQGNSATIIQPNQLPQVINNKPPQKTDNTSVYIALGIVGLVLALKI